jgi:hypothetical protein
MEEGGKSWSCLKKDSQFWWFDFQLDKRYGGSTKETSTKRAQRIALKQSSEQIPWTGKPQPGAVFDSISKLGRIREAGTVD